MKITYHVVVDAGGTVQKVFMNSRLAHVMAAQMSRPGNSYFVETVSRTKKPLWGTRLF
jgi:hypothetical protein